MQTIKNDNCIEIIVKKSKIIANPILRNSIEEAEEKIEQLKKKYYDARHNCYGYIVENFEKCSDDGEPSKTAGAPILDVLKKRELSNVLVVVTRYFGGILLGTGGLVRAYTKATQDVIDSSEIVNKIEGIRYTIYVDYENQKDVLYWCKKLNVNVINTKYDNIIELKLESTKANKEKLLNNIKILQNCIISDEKIYIEEKKLYIENENI